MQRQSVLKLLVGLAALLQASKAQPGTPLTATLKPYEKVVYKISLGSPKQINGQSLDPDISIYLTLLTGGRAGVYCNPSWYQGLVTAFNYPNPNNYVYASDNSKGINLITISREDESYRPAGTNATYTGGYTPSFICSVISLEAARSIDTSWVYTQEYSSPVLVAEEQSAIQAIYDQCCGAVNDTSQCGYWKAQNAANGGNFTNFCNFQNQDCSVRGNLQTLDLTGFGLNCGFPTKAISRFSNLQYLAMGDNPGLKGNISGILAGISSMGSLLEIYLQDNTGLTGQLSSGPSQGACGLPQSLETLTIQNSSLSGRLPDCLFSNASIYNLVLNNNQLTGSIPDVFSDASYIQVLNLAHNKLSGSIPSTLGSVSALCQLDLSYNNLTGTVPSNFDGLPQLQAISLRNNALSGILPTFGNANLENLVLDYNKFTGMASSWVTAPASLFVNASVYLITMSNNMISAPFPRSIGYLPYLLGLSLANNNFTGALPTEDGIFKNLIALNASHNNFNGTVPTWPASTPAFKGTTISVSFPSQFDVSYNQLSGMLPSFLSNSSVPAAIRSNVRLAGNKLTSNCGNTSFLYISDLQQQCQNLLAPAPARSGPAPAPATASRPASTPAHAPAAHAPAPTTSAISTQQGVEQPKGSSSLSGGAVAGIVIGVLLALAVAGGVYFVSSQRRRQQALRAFPGRQQSGFGKATRKALGRRQSDQPFLQSNALGFARFSDADMNQDDAVRGAHEAPAKDVRLFGV